MHCDEDFHEFRGEHNIANKDRVPIFFSFSKVLFAEINCVYILAYIYIYVYTHNQSIYREFNRLRHCTRRNEMTTVHVHLHMCVCVCVTSLGRYQVNDSNINNYMTHTKY